MWIECPKLFQNSNNNNNYYKWLNIGTHGSTSFALDSDKNSCILVACDNMYIMESKNECVFVEFLFHLIPLIVCN